MHVQLTQGIDVALLVFNAFVLFFVCLIFYLRREDRREGYPLEDATTGRLETAGGPLHTASQKHFLLPHGRGIVSAPTHDREPVEIAARRTDRFDGAPYTPTGNPLVDGIGPAAWANRRAEPDLDWEGHARIVPLASTDAFWVAKGDPDPRGLTLYGADGQAAGTVTDLWIDRADRLIRYLQFDGGPGVGAALVPMTMAKVKRGGVMVDALNAEQFAGVPRVAEPDSITLYEEERIQAYFGGGYLYATPSRSEPFL